MREYITKEQALRRFSYFGREIPKDMVFEVIASLQEEIVRCKDCKHKVTTEDGEWDPEDIVCNYWMSDGLTEKDFCSNGERSEDK